MTIKELRTTSLEYRRLASNMLRPDPDNVNIQIIRFKNFIDTNDIVKEIISEKISGIEYEYNECFKIGEGGWNSITPPVDESKHIKAQYDYMEHLCESKGEIKYIARMFPHNNGTSWSTMVNNFLEDAFKMLADFITDSLSIEIMLLEEENKSKQSMVQNIGTVYGSTIQGINVTSTNTTNVNETETLLSLISQAIIYINTVNISDLLKENFQDELEIISEQLVSNAPKKSRIIKAIEGVKKFVSDFAMELAVTSTAGVVVTYDWEALIQSIELFIQNIH